MIDYLCGRDADGHPGAGMGIRHGIAGYVPPGWRPDDGRPASALRRRKCGCGGTADTGDLKSPIGDDVRVRVPLTALVCACGESGSRAGGGQNLRIATPPVSFGTCGFEARQAQPFHGGVHGFDGIHRRFVSVQRLPTAIKREKTRTDNSRLALVA